MNRVVKDEPPTSTKPMDDRAGAEIEKQFPAAHLDEHVIHHVDPVLERRVVRKMDSNIIPVGLPLDHIWSIEY